MATVNTVLGPCTPEDLGFTLIHEHLTAGFPGWELDNSGTMPISAGISCPR